MAQPPLKIELLPSRKIYPGKPQLSPGKERKSRKMRKENQNVTADFKPTPMSALSPNKAPTPSGKIKVYAPINEEQDLDIDFDFNSRRKKRAPGESSNTSRSEDAEGGSRLNLGA